MKTILKIFLFVQILSLPLFARYDKIIAIGPGALRFVVYMQLEHKLCGVENIEFKLKKGIIRPYSIKLKNIIYKLPVIGEGGPGVLPYFEKINLIKPDIIIAVGFTKAQTELIEKKTQTKVIVLNYGNIGSLNKEFTFSIMKSGKIFNKEKRANELICYFNKLISDLKKRTENINLKKKIYIGGIAYKGLHDITSSDTEFFPAKLINVTNVADYSRLKGHIFINWEDLFLWNPDIIFIDRRSLPIIKSNFKKFRSRYLALKAYRVNKVFNILPYNYYNTNVELAFIDAYFMGKKVYPERFKDVNLKDKFQEIIKKFIGIKLNVQKINF